MEKFEIKVENGFLSIQIDRVFGFPETTSPFGGYDTESIIEIKCSSYYVKGLIWITTGDIYEFYNQLSKCHRNVKGQARLNSYENNLNSILTYDVYGHIVMKGYFTELNGEDTTLEFELKGDQSDINSTIKELETIILKYGDNRGIIKE